MDYVILRGHYDDRDAEHDSRVATEFFERVCAAGSQPAAMPVPAPASAPATAVCWATA